MHTPKGYQPEGYNDAKLPVFHVLYVITYFWVSQLSTLGGEEAFYFLSPGGCYEATLQDLSPKNRQDFL